ncbi:MAG: hypothetical protein IH623_05780 [Verrucomicrobia bacterium]|nr:hypothetical protein [Verrucomicrobiota bacterium]
MNTEIQYAAIGEAYGDPYLNLDPLNPRLGRENKGSNVSQDKVLSLMQNWTLEELAVSFVENGFWPQEALVVVKERLYGSAALIVVEGNRRLAALRFLAKAAAGEPANSQWEEIVRGKKLPEKLFSKVPYLVAESRTEVASFLGFRHVTGIKEWKPAEKAEFIAKLIESRNLSYEDVRKRIGSKMPAIRQHYISYRLLLQMEQREDIDLERVEKKFSVLYLSLRTEGVRKYLDIDIQADPTKAKKPVPPSRLKALAHFAQWLFGDDKNPPLFTDSRNVDKFGKALESPKAVQYLERTSTPNFDFALRVAGADEPELVDLLEGAADNIELALGRLHQHADSTKIKSAVERVVADADQLRKVVPVSSGKEKA